jgi:hypothetical protein
LSLEPGAQLNHGEPSKPRQAATVIVLAGGADTLEVLLAKRNPAQRFMGGAWVFPGGAVDAAEGSGDAAHRAAGVREVRRRARSSCPTRRARALLALDHPRDGQDPLRHALLPRRGARGRRAPPRRRGVRRRGLVHPAGARSPRASGGRSCSSSRR